MKTRCKLTLINGSDRHRRGILMYRFTNSLEIGGCPSGWPSVPPLPFPADDDWDDFDQAE